MTHSTDMKVADAYLDGRNFAASSSISPGQGAGTFAEGIKDFLVERTLSSSHKPTPSDSADEVARYAALLKLADLAT